MTPNERARRALTEGMRLHGVDMGWRGAYGAAVAAVSEEITGAIIDETESLRAELSASQRKVEELTRALKEYSDVANRFADTADILEKQESAVEYCIRFLRASAKRYGALPHSSPYSPVPALATEGSRALSELKP